MPFATTWMDLEGIMLSEISQRKTNTVCYQLYVEYKEKNRSRLIQRTNRWLSEWWVSGDMGEIDKRGLTSTNFQLKVNKSWQCNVQHREYSQ